MAHRAKHLRRNWIPERLKAAQERENSMPKRPKSPRRPVLPVTRFLAGR